MKFEEVIILMKDLNALHVKVLDTQSNRIIEITEEQSVENTIERLKNYLPMLSAHGKVTFVGATDSIKKMNWRDAFKWVVTFNSNAINLPIDTNAQNNNNRLPNGFISQNEAALMAELQALKLQMVYDKRFTELENKLTKGKSENFNIGSLKELMPLVPLFMPLDDAKLAQFVQMQGMVNMGQQNGISGTHTQTTQKTTLQITEQEKKEIEIFNDEIDLLSEKTSMEKLTQLVKGLNNNPEFIDMALTFINSKKQ